jgi:hypothetical protein
MSDHVPPRPHGGYERNARPAAAPGLPDAIQVLKSELVESFEAHAALG